jgi:hypothetical protein
MSWLHEMFSLGKSKERVRLDEEVRELRGKMAHAVVDNDRKTLELRQTLSGALRLRKEYDQ